MILIYTHHITPRIIYSSDLVFKFVLGIEYKLTDDSDYFKTYQQVKIAYTNHLNLSEITIFSDDLMFENNIKSFHVKAEKNYIDFPKFFESNINDFLGYDIFAMVFYFASRYEEYLPTDLDEHQRVKAENSLAYIYNCLHIPFLNIAIQQFGDKLVEQFPTLKFNKRTFNFVSTIDIDNAFAYANKGFKRNIAGGIKDGLLLNFNQVVQRIKSNISDQKDPYYTFPLIHTLHEETKTLLRYFVLIGDYSKYDKNPRYDNLGFKNLIKDLVNDYEIGLHPSYESFNHLEKIEIEKKRLENIIEKKVTSARCHFLRINLPDTYRAFINAGITDDYTMIYASQSGFRTGLCTPYPWFDLEKNQITSLTIHPSTIMEGTLRDYNGYTPEHANSVINSLLNEVKKQGGEFVSVWHNDSFVPSQKDWINVYKHLLEKSKISN